MLLKIMKQALLKTALNELMQHFIFIYLTGQKSDKD